MNSLRTAEMAMTEWKRGSVCVRERESEAHFSAQLLLPSLYFLGRKKWHGKKFSLKQIVQQEVGSYKVTKN